jgi:hypothetical protein
MRKQPVPFRRALRRGECGELERDPQRQPEAETAVPSPDDPPEFALWLQALRRRPKLPLNEREEIYWAIHDYFAEGVTADA